LVFIKKIIKLIFFRKKQQRKKIDNGRNTKNSSPLIDLDFSWGGISCSICVAAYVLHPKLLLFVLCTSQKKIKNL
jgi:hypothetical protein